MIPSGIENVFVFFNAIVDINNIFVLFLSKRIFDSNIKLLFLLTSISFRFLQDINVLLLIDSIVYVNTIFSIAVPPKA